MRGAEIGCNSAGCESRPCDSDSGSSGVGVTVWSRVRSNSSQADCGFLIGYICVPPQSITQK